MYRKEEDAMADRCISNIYRNPDAEWKRIQQNTFTRWVNQHLKKANKALTDLESDFSDGLRLIALIEVLSQKEMPSHNKKPKIRMQQLENVTIALEFLGKEGVVLVSIDSTHIVDRNLKMIKGMVWTLILHYAISMPMARSLSVDDQVNKTPKQQLMDWVNDQMPNFSVNNFTSDWRDGKAIGALVDSKGPGLCPDWEDWDPNKPVENATEAMDMAENWLNVPKLLTPEEMVNPNIDDQSMMTYLSQFPNAQLKPGAPLRKRGERSPKQKLMDWVRDKIPNCKINNFTSDWKDGKALGALVDAIAPGLCPDWEDWDPNNPAENCTKAMDNAEKWLNVPKLLTPEEMTNPATDEQSMMTYLSEYPNAQLQPGAPLRSTRGRDKVHAYGAGLEPKGVEAKVPSTFTVERDGSSDGELTIQIVDSLGRNIDCDIVKSFSVDDEDKVNYNCTYIPENEGELDVTILLANQIVAESPFHVLVEKLNNRYSILSITANGSGSKFEGI